MCVCVCVRWQLEHSGPHNAIKQLRAGAISTERPVSAPHPSHTILHSECMVQKGCNEMYEVCHQHRGMSAFVFYMRKFYSECLVQRRHTKNIWNLPSFWPVKLPYTATLLLRTGNILRMNFSLMMESENFTVFDRCRNQNV